MIEEEKMTQSEIPASQTALRHVAYTIAWLIGVVVVNRLLDEPIELIVPYMLPVVVLTWTYNIRWGLIAAAGATLAAAAGGALPSNDDVTLLEDGLYAYMELSAIALGVTLGQLTHRKLRGTQF